MMLPFVIVPSYYDEMMNMPEINISSPREFGMHYNKRTINRNNRKNHVHKRRFK